MEKMRNAKKRKGFTIIELIVVIAILGILAAIAIPRFSVMQGSANAKSVMSTLKSIETAAAAYGANANVATTYLDHDGTTNSDSVVETGIVAILGTAWPTSPTGVTYRLVDGVAYASVPNTLPWPTGMAAGADRLFVISELK